MPKQEVSISYNSDKIKKLLSLFKEDISAKIGILGSKASSVHPGSTETIGEIGAKHEFGRGVLRRSFLEDSLKLKLNFNKSSLNKLKKELFKQFFIKGTPEKFIKDMAAYALKIIQEAFATNGFGRWKPWSKSYEEYRKSLLKTKRAIDFMYLNGTTILTLTGQLRKSIAFKIIKKKKIKYNYG